ncbi:MAG: ATP-binding protein [Candidatus Bathyarchaeota archaeon]|nr:ATP-binding protein [Candidatus Bathyarchaeota archaeon]
MSASAGKTVGKIFAGDINEILIRERRGCSVELGALLVSEFAGMKILFEAVNVAYGSIVTLNECIDIAWRFSEKKEYRLHEEERKFYNVIHARPLAVINENGFSKPKLIPPMFGSVREISDSDLNFMMRENDDSVAIGSIRSGSSQLNTPACLKREAFTHHVLVAAATGRGKSNLVKVMLWNLMSNNKVGMLILDPHNEYYGVRGVGLKDHPDANKMLVYYSMKNSCVNQTLKINLESLKPHHFYGVIYNLTDPQRDAMEIYYHAHGKKWLFRLLADDKPPGDNKINLATFTALKRKLESVLGLRFDAAANKFDNKLNIFVDFGGESTVADITSKVTCGSKVVVDTSDVGGETELLIGNILADEIFKFNRNAKDEGKLDSFASVCIVLEEAPRVLSETEGDNAFTRIAREGRKFKVGLIAITQLVSVIPRDILANMNTKIIMGNELSTERRILIESAAQDLSKNDHIIASLDKGELIVSSIFTPFALPVKVPLFEDYIKNFMKPKQQFTIDVPG